MRLLLDTSVLIEIERNNLSMVSRLRSYKPREVCMSAISLIELEVGVELGKRRKKNRVAVDWLQEKFAVLPFDAKAARVAAKSFARQESKGERAGTFDALIAAHASALGIPVAYCDGDFHRFPGRKIVWAA